MYQLPGELPNFSTPRRGSVAPRLSTLLIVWVLVAGGYAAYRMSKHEHEPPSIASSERAPQHVPGQEEATQDYSRHLAEVTAIVDRAHARVLSSEKIIRLLLQSDGGTHTRALTTSLGNLDAARQDLDQSREELDFIQSNLKGTKQQ